MDATAIKRRRFKMEEVVSECDISEEPTVITTTSRPPQSGGNSDNNIAIPRHLGLLGCMWHLIGNIIGTGIFISPTGVLRGSGGSVGLAFVFWILCAIINTCGALTVAELSVIMRKSGGDFTFLLQAWGPLVAFIRLWVLVLIIGPSGAAIQSLVISKYILTPFFQCAGIPVTAVHLISFCVISFLIFVNCYSVRLSTNLAGVMTVAKIFGLCVLIVTGIYNLSKGHTTFLENVFSSGKPTISLVPVALLSGIWAYSGWSVITTVTEEIKVPSRNIPLSIVLSMGIITLVYLLANVAYLTLLSPEEILNSEAVAADYSVLALGRRWSWLIWVFVAMSAFGSLNSGLFRGPRIVFAAAREGHFPEIFSMVSIRQHTPLPAILFSFVSLVYLYEDDVIVLVELLGFADAIFETLTVAIVPYYRWKHPNLPRPFKVPLIVVFFYLATLVFIAAMSIYSDPVKKAIGLTMALIAIPAYYLLVHPTRRCKCLFPLLGRVTRFLQKLLLCVHQEKKTY